jgi:HEAT repeat protein
MDLLTLQVNEPWQWPPGTSDFLHEFLTDRSNDDSALIEAAGFAGEIVAINDQLCDDLLAIVTDASRSDELRGMAAISLGPVLEQCDMSEWDDPYDDPPITEETFDKVKDALHRLYEDSTLPKQVRRRILEASVRAEGDWHAAAVEAAYASGDREWMLTAVFAMRYVKGFDPQILEALNNGDPEIHMEAVQAAGTQELEGAWPHIRAILKNRKTSEDLLFAAIEAAGYIGGEEAVEILEEFSESENEEISEAADEALTYSNLDMDDIGEEDDDEEE